MAHAVRIVAPTWDRGTQAFAVLDFTVVPSVGDEIVTTLEAETLRLVVEKRTFLSPPDDDGAEVVLECRNLGRVQRRSA